MQFSLSDFDPSAQKKLFKVTINNKTLKNIFFREAFSETELKGLFPDAIVSEVKRKIY